MQNTLLSALLAVVRSQSPPEEPCVSSAVRIVTQLWSRMSPDQVRSKYAHTHTQRQDKGLTVGLYSLQVQTQPVLQSTLQLLLSLSAVLVKHLDHQVITQVRRRGFIRLDQTCDELLFDTVCLCVPGSAVCGRGGGGSGACRAAAAGGSGVPLLPGEDLCSSRTPGIVKTCEPWPDAFPPLTYCMNAQGYDEFTADSRNKCAFKHHIAILGLVPHFDSF